MTPSGWICRAVHRGLSTIALLATPLVAAACSTGPSTAPNTGPTTELFAEALEACRENSINRARLDWAGIETEGSRRIASGASTTEVMEWLVAELDDGHSVYLSPARAAEFLGTADAGGSGDSASTRALPQPLDPTGRSIRVGNERTVGYIRVTHLVSMDTETMNDYSDTLVRLQEDLRGEGATAWIIDLRRNVGGNQWPMLAGLAAILGDTELGSITMPNGQQMSWGTRGTFAWAGVPEQVAYEHRGAGATDTSHWPVAVLTDELTASSGEAVAVSFIGRERTMSFGGPTAGKSSSNASVQLSNGSLLNITTSAMRDRRGVPYGGPIEPDHLLALPAATRESPFPGTDGAPDPALQAALTWIAGLPQDG